MKIRSLFAAVVLLVVGSVGNSQPPVGPSPQTQNIPPLSVPKTPPVTAPAEKTVDEMLDELESLRGQKAELEKKEAELVKAIQRKIEKQADRLNRLGIGAPVVPTAPVLPQPLPVPNPNTSFRPL